MEAGNRRYELSGCNGFLSVYAALGNACSDMPVVVAKGGDFLEFGTIPILNRFCRLSETKLPKQTESMLV